MQKTFFGVLLGEAKSNKGKHHCSGGKRRTGTQRRKPAGKYWWNPAFPGLYSASCRVSPSPDPSKLTGEKGQLSIFKDISRSDESCIFITFEGNFPIMLLLYLLTMAESRKQKNSAALTHNLNQAQFSAWEPYFAETVEIYYFSIKGNNLATYVSRILPFVELEFAPVHPALCADMSKFQDPGNVPVQCLHGPSPSAVSLKSDWSRRLQAIPCLAVSWQLMPRESLNKVKWFLVLLLG